VAWAPGQPRPSCGLGLRKKVTASHMVTRSNGLVTRSSAVVHGNAGTCSRTATGPLCRRKRPAAEALGRGGTGMGEPLVSASNEGIEDSVRRRGAARCLPCPAGPEPTGGITRGKPFWKCEGERQQTIILQCTCV